MKCVYSAYLLILHLYLALHGNPFRGLSLVDPHSKADHNRVLKIVPVSKL